mmetsp:Transcript_58257/g.142443  ORF Transcript_58257/g.142443 Transcript_58257/m.142443 type:complete len:809 (-) Transcript_58257:90-2516(-)
MDRGNRHNRHPHPPCRSNEHCRQSRRPYYHHRPLTTASNRNKTVCPIVRNIFVLVVIIFAVSVEMNSSVVVKSARVAAKSATSASATSTATAAATRRSRRYSSSYSNVASKGFLRRQTLWSLDDHQTQTTFRSLPWGIDRIKNNTSQRSTQKSRPSSAYYSQSKNLHFYGSLLHSVRGGGSGDSNSTNTTTSDTGMKLEALRHKIKPVNIISRRLSTSSRSVSSSSESSSSSSSKHLDHLSHRVYIAVGSNLGDRHFNIKKGLDMLCSPDYDDETYQETRLMKTSFLYHTAPMYVTDQPPFLNGVVEVETELPPLSLLKRMKHIERDLGRNFTQIRNGPRPLDLDILLYYNQTSTTSESDNNDDCDWMSWSVNETDPVELIVPHPRIAEREFVLAPLVDLAGRDLIHPITEIVNTSAANTSETDDESKTQQETTSFGNLLDSLLNSQNQQDEDGEIPPPGASRLIPLPLGRYLLFPSHPDSTTLIMGILNVTPDSFSDGGQYNTNVAKAIDQAFQMVEDGATIIDIGGESTRPGAKEVSVEEQIQRIVPVIEGIRAKEQEKNNMNNGGIEGEDVLQREPSSRTKIVNSDVGGSEHSSIVISVDTRHAAVARAAIRAGADIVNDVSGGTFDAEMLPTVAELGVPIIMMHMRGTPETMQQMTDYGNGTNADSNLVDEVIKSLLERSEAASSAGIPRWMQILDVGIGFAKDFDGNLQLLKDYGKIRRETGGLPLLLGTSRKGFLGTITGETVAPDRDDATIGSCLTTLCLASTPGQGGSNGQLQLGYNILRVHNVRAVHQATMVMDAIVNK